MSWSVNLVGKPANIKIALAQQSSKSTGQSKQEFDDALPHLNGLLDQYVLTDEKTLVKLVASGSACFTNGKKTQGHIQVELNSLWLNLC